ncbi:hypothetical protein H072_6823 [Dactylellina haptotyla CBS 200.50]|uniref:Uncharacterized protein n=1 Tax=Dactylellina haptotyla (strain CBS 200.50) TaxID=1284197 RepID=S8BVU4_DACHA|nr:hypothetical protein H072_6823 [Dactylellina haptotyla CBS 200.50]
MFGLFKRSATLQIYIAAYDRGVDANGNPKPDHWAIIVSKSLSHAGTAHHVIHGHPLFEYRPRDDVYVLKSQSLAHVLNIGKISEKDVAKIEEVFEKVAVNNVDKEWNCQDWVLEAVSGIQGLKEVSLEKGLKVENLKEAVKAASDGRDYN